MASYLSVLNLLQYEKKVSTVIVNHSINNTNNQLSLNTCIQIFRWNSKSWYCTVTGLWRGLTGYLDPTSHFLIIDLQRQCRCKLLKKNADSLPFKEKHYHKDEWQHKHGQQQDEWMFIANWLLPKKVESLLGLIPLLLGHNKS
jgi:hypothetical protein